MSTDERTGVPSLLVVLCALSSLLTGVVGLGHAGTPSSPGDANGALAPHVSGEILVKFKPAAEGKARANLRATLGTVKQTFLRESVELFKLAPGDAVEKVLASLRDDPLIEYAEPNYLYWAERLPNDPRFQELYGLKNAGQTGGTPDADIDADAAWDVTTGSHDVVVAIIDTGIDSGHPDLAANIWTNPGEIPHNGIDDDDNGFVDDVLGWDFFNGDNDPWDDHGHGTHVAGTVGAVGDNGTGVTGVNWKVSLVAIKLLNSEGGGNTAAAVASIEYAVAIGADVINASWGGGPFSEALFEAVLTAAAADVLFVAAAGNDGSNNDVTQHYPSNYDSPNVLAVAASDDNDEIAWFSNFGRETVDLAAPGAAVLSTLPGGYGLFDGTSMAAPHVSGAAALILSVRPDLGAVELKNLLLSHVDPVVGLVPLTSAGGRLSAFGPIASQDEIAPGPIDDLVVAQAGSNSIDLQWTATGDDGADGSASSYDIRFATTLIDDFNFDSAQRVADSPHPQPSGRVELFEVGGLQPATPYYFAIKAEDEWGNPGPLSNVVSAAPLPSPSLATWPAVFSVSLPMGRITETMLTIHNAGVGRLDWQIPRPLDVEITNDAQWLSASPGAGRLFGGESVEAILSVDARALDPGIYETTLRVESNDPRNPAVDHPVTLEVTGAPVIEITPESLDFGPVFVGTSATGSLEVANLGTHLLTVHEVRTGSPSIVVAPEAFTVPPGGTRNIDVHYAPSGPAVLLLVGNAANRPTLEVPLSGTATLPPRIHVFPAAFSESVAFGESITRTLLIGNSGASDLVATLSYEPDFPLPILVNGGFESGDFTGWTASVNDSGELTPWTVAPAGSGWFGNSAPLEGRFDALNGFDGLAGLEYVLSQNFIVPPDITGGELVFHDRIQFDSLGLPSALPRVYEATLRDVAGNRLATLVLQEIELDGSEFTDHGWRRRSVDLLPYAGQPVRVQLSESVPESFSGPAAIEFDDFRVNLEDRSDWLLLGESSVLVPAGASITIEVTLSAGAAPSTVLDGFVRIESNDPSSPVVRVPVELTVAGDPDNPGTEAPIIGIEPTEPVAVAGTPSLGIHGPLVRAESTRNFDTSGATTTHDLAVPAPPEGGGILEVIADGDFGVERATISVETLLFGSVGGIGPDCMPARVSFPIDAQQLADLASDRVVEVEVANEPNVDSFCTVNSHTVVLSYHLSTQPVDFGTTFVGWTTEKALHIENSGTDILYVDSIGASHPEFSPHASSIAVYPGTSASLPVVFTPSGPTSFSATLSITSNDPDAPSASIEMIGVGSDPPVIGVAPSTLELSLVERAQVTVRLTLSNSGASSLEYSMSVSPTDATFVSLPTAAGSLPPGGEVPIDVVVDALELTAGLYEVSIEVTSNDPATPVVSVPLRVEVTGLPSIAVGEPLSSESHATYTHSGALTFHAMPLAAPPVGDGSLSLIARGDFGQPNETATATVEGVFLGSVGGVGYDCTPAQASFVIGRQDLTLFGADGVVRARVRNSPAVGGHCDSTNGHWLRLSYFGAVGALDFGVVPVGSSSDRRIAIVNLGTAALRVSAMTSDEPAFWSAATTLVVAPDSSEWVTLTFAPGSSASFGGSLTIASDDPDSPLTSIALSGEGLEPSALAVSPPSLAATLPVDGRQLRALTLSNTGSAESGFVVEIRTPSLANDGEFELLAPSEVPLACVAADPARGHVYAQANRTREFFRYDASTNGWTELPTAPVASGNNCGAALLDGKIYTAYTDSIYLGVYDIASESWSTIPAAVERTGNIASDGSRYLYQVAGTTFRRIDPSLLATTTLASPPFSFERWGGLGILDGTLYGHQGNRSTSFAAYDIAADRWAVLPSVPGGTVLGAAVDPISREYYAYGSYGEQNLYRYSIDDDSWSVATIPFFRVDDGGLAWLPGPVGGVYIIEGQQGLAFARRVVEVPFLSVTPSSGSLGSGDSVELTAIFDAETLVLGRYEALLTVVSSDPTQPTVVVPAELTVIGTPSIVLAGDPVEFGTVFVGTARTLPLTIANHGTGDLEVTSISIDAAEVSVSASVLTVPPTESIEVAVSYRPLAAGTLSAQLRIASNDPDEPLLAIELTARAAAPPRAVLQPKSVEAALPPRSHLVKRRSLQLANDGRSELAWRAELTELFAVDSLVAEWDGVPQGDESVTGHGPSPPKHRGGPDEFGYEFIDSDVPDGPSFEWLDIADSGTAIPLSGDDQISGLLPIGFGFPFYGASFTAVRVCTNGWLSFTSTKTTYSNPDTLPDGGFSLPENLIAPFWDDLDLAGAERITYDSDATRFVVQFTRVSRFASSDELTFQVVLYPSGRIVFSYLAMMGVRNSATIGIQNQDRSIGLLVSSNETYVHDGLTVEIIPIPPWAAIEPAFGVIRPGESVDLELQLRSSDLADGDHHARVLVFTNDPANAEIQLPVTLHARLVELDHTDFDPNTLNLSSRGKAVRAALQLPPAYDPHAVVISSVSTLESLFAEPSPVSFEDRNRDGVPEIVVRFDRESFARLLPEGDQIPVTVTGEVADTVWFTGTGQIRTIRPGTTARPTPSSSITGSPSTRGVRVPGTPVSSVGDDQHLPGVDRAGARQAVGPQDRVQ